MKSCFNLKYDFDSGDKPSSSSADNRSDNQKRNDAYSNDNRIEDFLSDLLSRQDNLTQAEKSAPTVQALIGLASKWGVNPWEVDIKQVLSIKKILQKQSRQVDVQPIVKTIETDESGRKTLVFTINGKIDFSHAYINNAKRKSDFVKLFNQTIEEIYHFEAPDGEISYKIKSNFTLGDYKNGYNGNMIYVIAQMTPEMKKKNGENTNAFTSQIGGKSIVFDKTDLKNRQLIGHEFGHLMGLLHPLAYIGGINFNGGFKDVDYTSIFNPSNLMYQSNTNRKDLIESFQFAIINGIYEQGFLSYNGNQFEEILRSNSEDLIHENSLKRAALLLLYHYFNP